MLLLLLFAAGFGLRILQFVQTGHIVGVDGYYHLRIADEYAKGDFSNFVSYPPGIHLISASFSYLTGSAEASLAILSAFFSSLAIIGVFLITRQRFGQGAALLSAVFIAFSAQAVSYGSLVKNLNFSIAILAFGIWLSYGKRMLPFMATTAILALFSPLDAAALAAIAMISSLMPAATGKGKIDRKKLYISIALLAAAALFGTLYINGSFASLYLTKSLPESMLNILFYTPSAQDFLLRLSPFLLVFAAAGLWTAARKKESLELVIAVAALAVAFPLGIIETDRWYVYSTLFLSVFAGYGLFLFWEISRTSKKALALFTAVMLSILLSGLVLSAAALEANSWGLMTKERYSQLEWLRENTPTNSVVLGTISESHWIFGVAMRTPVATANLIEDPAFSGHINDIEKIYTTTDRHERERLLDAYNISYIMISDKTWWLFGDVMKNFEGPGFREVYEDGIYAILEYTPSASD